MSCTGRFILGLFAATLLTPLACQQSIPAGIEPITVYVVDAISGAPLCSATVTLNDTPMTAGGGNSIGCYFVPAQSLSSGASFALAVSQTGYVSQSENGQIAQDGSSLVIQLVPLDGDSGVVDAGPDVANDVVNDGVSDVVNDVASDAVSE